MAVLDGVHRHKDVNGRQWITKQATGEAHSHADHETRIAKLEADMVLVKAAVATGSGGTVTPPPVTPPPPPPSSGGSPAGTHSGVTPVNSAQIIWHPGDGPISGKNFVAAIGDGTGTAILVQGTPGAHVIMPAIHDCTSSGFRQFVQAEYADADASSIIQNNTVLDVFYAAFLMASCAGKGLGQIVNNTIQRVGRQTPTLIAGGDNAYGIAFLHDWNAGSDANGTPLAPPSNGWEAGWNLLTDIYQWMGINSHSGSDLYIHDNEMHRVRRGVFLAPYTGYRPTGDRVINNKILDMGTCQQATAIEIMNLNGPVITGNQIDTAYAPPPTPYNYVFDYKPTSADGSTGVVSSGNTLV